jgi:hypothetical protein
MQSIQIIIAAAIIIIYTVADAFRDAFMFRDFRGKLRMIDVAYAHLAAQASENTKWHRMQSIQQSAVLIGVAYLSGCWQVAFCGAALFWLVHDWIVNVIGLNRPVFYVGMTAWIDRMFRKFFRKPEIAMGVAKIVCLIAGIASFWIKSQS